MEVCLKILHCGIQLASVGRVISLTYWLLVFFSLPLMPTSLDTMLFVIELCLSEISFRLLHLPEINVLNTANIGSGKSLALQVIFF